MGSERDLVWSVRLITDGKSTFDGGNKRGMPLCVDESESFQTTAPEAISKCNISLLKICVCDPQPLVRVL